MTDTTTAAPATRRPGSLSALRLAELQALATSMGITGTGKMRKSDLITAIKAQQSGDVVPARTAAAEPVPAEASAPATKAAAAPRATDAP
ncbi:Rho termination factor N-terminal domain-containing protein, partial [Kribbia dieselivorans]|uniref:Rho termination factor N-terminal domain-containing protein n=1 Tax=Kribbia dieselivorans TaxID=331526 RepID=UPI00157A84DA